MVNYLAFQTKLFNKSSFIFSKNQFCVIKFCFGSSSKFSGLIDFSHLFTEENIGNQCKFLPFILDVYSYGLFVISFKINTTKSIKSSQSRLTLHLWYSLRNNEFGSRKGRGTDSQSLHKGDSDGRLWASLSKYRRRWKKYTHINFTPIFVII